MVGRFLGVVWVIGILEHTCTIGFNWMKNLKLIDMIYLGTSFAEIKGFYSDVRAFPVEKISIPIFASLSANSCLSVTFLFAALSAFNKEP